MAELYQEIDDEAQRLARGSSQARQYWDRKTYSSFTEQKSAMAHSQTLYVGNLSFFTSEAQLYEWFSRVGHVDRVIVGLDRFKKTPCGFCFVEFSCHAEAAACAQFLSETKLDSRVVRCELDGGFREGRQFGRGLSGGQVRDDRRAKDDYDAGRGGFGRGDDATADGHHFRRSVQGKRLRKESDALEGGPTSRARREESPARAKGFDDDEGATKKEEEENPRFRHRENEDGDGDRDDNEDVVDEGGKEEVEVDAGETTEAA
ncbi:unnamed protein product [Hyaloperonospora brassicae]|uniref:Nuclear cap-binding protein subunit 2 n=1 Tax=Hyaloperonospora brassicae TaxID=162125 RepID=A0AAV0V2X4_HYABA|nr:unnamed protein product [Hyaloperonospora brassicae]